MSNLGWRAMADLDSLRTEAEAAIAAASSSAELEELRVRYLGRKSELTQTLRSIGELPPEQRGPVGKEANEVRRALEGLLERQTAQLGAGGARGALAGPRGAGAGGGGPEERPAEDRVDVTLPGDPPMHAGHLHLVSQ